MLSPPFVCVFSPILVPFEFDGIKIVFGCYDTVDVKWTPRGMAQEYSACGSYTVTLYRGATPLPSPIPSLQPSSVPTNTPFPTATPPHDLGTLIPRPHALLRHT